MVRGLKQTFAVVHGAGECAALVAEELAFREGFADGAAMHGHKRVRAALLVKLVDGLGEDLFARTSFPF